MPPKRKRAGEDAAPGDAPPATTRATRSSARPKKNAENGDTKSAVASAVEPPKAKGRKVKGSTQESDAKEPPAKKTKTTKATKSNSASAAKTKAKETSPPTNGSMTSKSTSARGKTQTTTNDITATSGTSQSTSARASTSKVAEEALPPAPTTALAASKPASTDASIKKSTSAATAPSITTSPTIPSTPTTAPSRATTAASAVIKSTSTSKLNISAPGPYTPARATVLFEHYADEDEPDFIGPEGLERLCSDAEVPMEGAGPLVLAWLLGTKEMGKIAKSEWVKGMDELQIASVAALHVALEEMQDLVMTNKPAAKPTQAIVPPGKGKRASGKAGTGEPYNRARYHQAAADRRAAFAQLYNFCFVLAKPEQSRNLDMDTASAFWSVLLAPKYPIVSEILDFVNETGTYKAANKDLWSMTLEFCETINPNLDNFEADGAWPTMIDEFVEWKRVKTSA